MSKSQCARVDFEDRKSAEVFTAAAILGLHRSPFFYSCLGDEEGELPLSGRVLKKLC